jgi:hypothetical protein
VLYAADPYVNSSQRTALRPLVERPVLVPSDNTTAIVADGCV